MQRAGRLFAAVHEAGNLSVGKIAQESQRQDGTLVARELHERRPQPIEVGLTIEQPARRAELAWIGRLGSVFERRGPFAAQLGERLVMRDPREPRVEPIRARSCGRSFQASRKVCATTSSARSASRTSAATCRAMLGNWSRYRPSNAERSRSRARSTSSIGDTTRRGEAARRGASVPTWSRGVTASGCAPGPLRPALSSTIAFPACRYRANRRSPSESTSESSWRAQSSSDGVMLPDSSDECSSSS